MVAVSRLSGTEICLPACVADLGVRTAHVSKSLRVSCQPRGVLGGHRLGGSGSTGSGYL